MADDEKRLTLRLPTEVYNSLQEYADKNNQSLNSAIITLIENNGRPKYTELTFEQKHLIGIVVPYKNIDTDTGIIMVKGLVYRYITEDNNDVVVGKDYKVIMVNGNVLVITINE